MVAGTCSYGLPGLLGIFDVGKECTLEDCLRDFVTDYVATKIQSRPGKVRTRRPAPVALLPRGNSNEFFQKATSRPSATVRPRR